MGTCSPCTIKCMWLLIQKLIKMNLLHQLKTIISTEARTHQIYMDECSLRKIWNIKINYYFSASFSTSKSYFILWTHYWRIIVWVRCSHSAEWSAFASHTLSSAEINYAVMERECLIDIWALNKFRVCFSNIPVTVIMDHSDLTKLTYRKGLPSRMIR